jgi:hypothetical protein
MPFGELQQQNPPLYGPAVTADKIATALVELPDTIAMAKWYGLAVGLMVLYVVVKVSERR